MSGGSRLTLPGAVLVIDKPAGWTSHDVVGKLRGGLRERRIGHAGTLDPDATGVLVVGVGRATRLLRFLQETTKAYRGVVRFGIATDTLDAAGVETERVAMEVSRADVERAALGFLGEIEQIPPMVSAIKVDGRRLHELAREGVEVERAARPVRIDRLDVVGFAPGEHAEAEIVVECSSGTYIRTLAADLGAALGGVAHLKSLRRERVGALTLADAHTIDEVIADPDGCALAMLDGLGAMARVDVDDEVAALVRNGRKLDPAQLLPADVAEGPGPWAVAHAGELLAVYERHRHELKPAVVVGG